MEGSESRDKVYSTVELLDKNNIRVLMFDAPYNREVKGENVTRVRSWEEVERYIKATGEGTERISKERKIRLPAEIVE